MKLKLKCLDVKNRFGEGGGGGVTRTFLFFFDDGDEKTQRQATDRRHFYYFFVDFSPPLRIRSREETREEKEVCAITHRAETKRTARSLRLRAGAR